jgi:16S rRNA (cytosine1402-N4)-methyltransferase
MDPIYQHKSVLVTEVLQYLDPQPGGIYIDVTFGGGGHTRAILEQQKNCSVVALDWDKHALELNGEKLQQEYPDRVQLVWGNFAQLYTLLKKADIAAVNGILADFGTSQYQLKHGAGFSFSQDTPLDMRMSPAHQKVTAAELVNKASEEKLRQLFWQLGEEKYAKQIVNAIAAKRKDHYIGTTKELATIIEHAVPVRGKIHPATRVFQALRMYINHELENIQSFLSEAVRVLQPGGRLVVISFHSLEDRLVKQFFSQRALQGGFNLLTPRAVVASEDEILTNPSSRSARLRAIEKVA